MKIVRCIFLISTHNNLGSDFEIRGKVTVLNSGDKVLSIKFVDKVSSIRSIKRLAPAFNHPPKSTQKKLYTQNVINYAITTKTSNMSKYQLKILKIYKKILNADEWSLRIPKIL